LLPSSNGCWRYLSLRDPAKNFHYVAVNDTRPCKPYTKGVGVPAPSPTEPARVTLHPPAAVEDAHPSLFSHLRALVIDDRRRARVFSP
jgi:hypothetical protein